MHAFTEEVHEKSEGVECLANGQLSFNHAVFHSLL
jgi:hypothetical protein